MERPKRMVEITRKKCRTSNSDDSITTDYSRKESRRNNSNDENESYTSSAVCLTKRLLPQDSQMYCLPEIKTASDIINNSTINLITLQASMKDLPKQIEGAFDDSDHVSEFIESIKKELQNENDEKFDDSELDPNFTPSNYSSEGSVCDYEVHEMGQETENNIVMLCSSNTAPSCSSGMERMEKGSNEVAYETKSGKDIPKRQVKPLMKCRTKCAEKITCVDQKKLFDEYWSLKQHNLRVKYCADLIEVNEKKSQSLTKSKFSPRNRTHSSSYFFGN